MSETREMVVRLLTSYPAKKARLEQLRYELRCMTSRSESDIIEELALRGSGLGGSAQKGHISDKTMTIAFEYHGISRRMSSDAVSEIARDIADAGAEVERIEKYVSLLEEFKSSIISLYYFQKKTWDELETLLRTRKRSLQRYRDCAIDELASMYSYIVELEKKAGGH